MQRSTIYNAMPRAAQVPRRRFCERALKMSVQQRACSSREMPVQRKRQAQRQHDAVRAKCRDMPIFHVSPPSRMLACVQRRHVSPSHAE